MKRLLVGLVMSAWLLMAVFAVPALGDMGEPPGGDKGDEEPGEVYCEWFGPYHEPGWDSWWEYWCWYGHPWYEWYFVLWVYN